MERDVSVTTQPLEPVLLELTLNLSAVVIKNICTYIRISY